MCIRDRKIAGEIVTGIQDLREKLLDNTTDDWEKQQLSKEVVRKKEQLDRLLEAVKENNQKKSDLNRSFTVQDSLLICLLYTSGYYHRHHTKYRFFGQYGCYQNFARICQCSNRPHRQ